jgi:hypothetical protein
MCPEYGVLCVKEHVTNTLTSVTGALPVPNRDNSSLKYLT